MSNVRATGFPVILISGLGGLASYWQDQKTAFSRVFPFVTFDHRGVGQSDHVRMKYTVEKMAEDVVALMDALGIDKAHIIGHSTGAAIAQVLALDHARRVAAVVLAAGWPKAGCLFPPRIHDAARNPGRAGSHGLCPECQPDALSPCLDSPQQREAARARGATGGEFPADRDHGQPDRSDHGLRPFGRTEPDQGADPRRRRSRRHVTPAYYSEALARAIPNAELKMFGAGGHCFTYVMPRDFNQAVLPFLQANTPKA
ncbi:MAG: alpha/beta fold hydrolase [Aliidongia sp.]